MEEADQREQEEQEEVIEREEKAEVKEQSLNLKENSRWNDERVKLFAMVPGLEKMFAYSYELRDGTGKKVKNNLTAKKIFYFKRNDIREYFKLIKKKELK